MNRQKFIVDFDMTLVNSVKAYCETYNILYSKHPKFKPADYTKVTKYSMNCQCPLVKQTLDMFEETLMFKNLEFINENTYEVLQKLNEKYQLIICSIGTPLNIAQKALWLERNVPFIKNYVLISNEQCKMDKSIVNMENAIFLDDIPSNLKSSNAETKILFGERFSWNNHWNGEYCKTWSKVAEMFL